MAVIGNHVLLWLIGILLFFITQMETVTLIRCPPGTYSSLVDGHTIICIPCLPGTYASKANQTQCDECTKISEDDSLLAVLAECTSIRDTVVKCKDSKNFYDSAHKTCLPCSACETFDQFVVKPCSDFQDTICCPVKGMELTNARTCTLYCSVGQYFVSGAQDSGIHDMCLPCPPGQTNYESRHQQRSCKETCREIADTRSGRVVQRRLQCRSDETMLARSCVVREDVYCTLNSLLPVLFIPSVGIMCFPIALFVVIIILCLRRYRYVCFARSSLSYKKIAGYTF